MKVSIIIPVYNTEKYLEECLKSVLNQKTEYEYEVIVINDGSTDNSSNIIKKYKSKIILIEKNNTGPGDSRNQGIKKSSGEYILFVDSDDYVPEDFVQTMVSTIINEKVDIVIGDFYRIEEKKLKHIKKGISKKYEKGNYNEVLLMEFHSCNKIFKKNHFIYFPTDIFFEDVVSISKTILKANNIYKLEKPVYYYRKTVNSTTCSLDNKIYDMFIAINLIEEDFIKNGYYEEIEFLYINNILVDLIIKVIKSNHNQKWEITKNLFNDVSIKYPYWYKNKYLKKINIFKILYLFCLKFRLYIIIDIIY